MVVFTDYRKKSTNDMEWVAYNGKVFAHIDPVEIPNKILEYIKRGENDIYISNMSLYLDDIVQAFYIMGFNFLEGNPPVKKMHNNEVKYLINGDFVVYSFTAKYNKRGVYVVNASNILSTKDRNKIIRTWSESFEGSESERYALATYRAIRDILTDVKAEKQKPVTISACARRQWNRIFLENNGEPVTHFLPDANRIVVGEKETLEKYVRKSYHGGLCLNMYDIRQGDTIGEIKTHGNGVVLDVNSLYPYIMANYPLPYGNPHYVTGKPPKNIIRDSNKGYIYFFIRIRATFDLKQGGVPCVALSVKDKDRFLHDRGWLKTSKYYNYKENRYFDTDERHTIELTLTQTDYQLFIENYDIVKIEYIDFVWFPTSKSLFSAYVGYYYNKKKEAQADGYKRIYKMLLNGLSGNMARVPEYENVIISIDKAGNIAYDFNTSAGGKSYVYVGSAITSYARQYLINAGKSVFDRWLYSDTDSLHILGSDIPKNIKVGNGLGEWKIEKEFDEICYYKTKMYGYKKENDIHLTLAGIPNDTVAQLERIASTGDTCTDELDVMDYKVRKLTDEEAQAVKNFFADCSDDYDGEIIRGIDRDFENHRYKIQKIVDDIKINPLVKIYFSDIPVTNHTHAGFFEEGLYTQTRSLYDEKDMFL